MATISEALGIAMQRHAAGQLEVAEELYRQILTFDSNCVDAWHLMGVIASQKGNYARAAEHIGEAIRINGAIPAFHNNLGNAYRSQGKLAEAIQSYRRAIELNSGTAETHNNLGSALQAQGRSAEAVQSHC